MRGPYLLLFSILFLLSSCEDEAPSVPFEGEEFEPEWLIPSQHIRSGGVGKDGIPSIDNPIFVNINQGDAFVSPEDLVVLVKYGDVVKAYPYKIMDYHEIVNDQIEDRYYALNYCPLTGTAMAWNRKLKLGVTTFGVSGLLFQSNLIPFDRETESDWSQMLRTSVRGFYKGEKIISYPVIETRWQTAKEMYPGLKVLSTETGYNRPYQVYPYDDYITADAKILFPIVNVDYRLPFKERVHGFVVNEESMIFKREMFKSGPKLIQGEFEGEPFVVYGDYENDLFVSFSRKLKDGNPINFNLSEDSMSLQDEDGNTWDLFGYHISGPGPIEDLKLIDGITGYWFTFGSFFPQPVLYSP